MKQDKKVIGGGTKKENKLKSGSQDEPSPENSSSEAYDECGVANCSKPSESVMHWIQCDGGCNKWFHMCCVGLNHLEVEDDMEYICDVCKKLKPSNSSSNDTNQITKTNESRIEPITAKISSCDNKL